jgi:uncharacterized protein YndB with AHSA1/START domain
MDEVFKALADASRRRLLDSLNARNGQSLRELCAGLEMARQSVSKHLAVLEAAERWIDQYDRERVRARADLKTALEQDPMGNTEFVYTTYINTTPERLWQALTDPAFTRRYWGVTFESDWKVGSTMTWEQEGVTITDPAQVVLEFEPHRRLAYSWHTFTPEFAETVGLSDEVFTKMTSERRSKVTFEIEPLGQMVKLTIVHDDFEPGSTVVEMVSEGWPHLLSDLKTLLETSETLPASPNTARQEEKNPQP